MLYLVAASAHVTIVASGPHPDRSALDQWFEENDRPDPSRYVLNHPARFVVFDLATGQREPFAQEQQP
jgi:hypothetical protein